LFCVPSKCRKCSFARCASAANVIRADGGIFNGNFVLIEDLLHVDIFTQITTLDRFYGTVLSLALHINCAFNLGKILVMNLITFFIFFLLFFLCQALFQFLHLCIVAFVCSFSNCLCAAVSARQSVDLNWTIGLLSLYSRKYDLI
jgi:hypothetical protein